MSIKLTPKNVIKAAGLIIMGLALVAAGFTMFAGVASLGTMIGTWLASPVFFPGFSVFEKIVVALLTVICFVQVFGSNR